MDLEKFHNGKYISHWAEELEVGDKCLATIRHKTDGEKNLQNVEIIVVSNDIENKKVIGFFSLKKRVIPYNDLAKIL